MGSHLLEESGCQTSLVLSFEANVIIYTGEYLSVYFEIVLKVSKIQFNFGTSLIFSFIPKVSDKLSKPWR